MSHPRSRAMVRASRAVLGRAQCAEHGIHMLIQGRSERTLQRQTRGLDLHALGAIGEPRVIRSLHTSLPMSRSWQCGSAVTDMMTAFSGGVRIGRNDRRVRQPITSHRLDRESNVMQLCRRLQTARERQRYRPDGRRTLRGHHVASDRRQPRLAASRTDRQPASYSTSRTRIGTGLRDSAANAALQILSAAKQIELAYKQAMDAIASVLSSSIIELRSKEGACWNLVIQSVCTSAPGADKTCTAKAGACTTDVNGVETCPQGSS